MLAGLKFLMNSPLSVFTRLKQHMPGLHRTLCLPYQPQSYPLSVLALCGWMVVAQARTRGNCLLLTSAALFLPIQKTASRRVIGTASGY